MFSRIVIVGSKEIMIRKYKNLHKKNKNENKSMNKNKNANQKQPKKNKRTITRKGEDDGETMEGRDAYQDVK